MKIKELMEKDAVYAKQLENLVKSLGWNLKSIEDLPVQTFILLLIKESQQIFTEMLEVKT